MDGINREWYILYLNPLFHCSSSPSTAKLVCYFDLLLPTPNLLAIIIAISYHYKIRDSASLYGTGGSESQ